MTPKEYNIPWSYLSEWSGESDIIKKLAEVPQYLPSQWLKGLATAYYRSLSWTNTILQSENNEFEDAKMYLSTSNTKENSNLTIFELLPNLSFTIYECERIHLKQNMIQEIIDDENKNHKYGYLHYDSKLKISINYMYRWF